MNMPVIQVTDADEDLNELYGSDLDEVLHGRWMEEAEQQRRLYELEYLRQLEDEVQEGHNEHEVDEEAKAYDFRLVDEESEVELNEGNQGTLSDLQPPKLAWSEEENNVEEGQEGKDEAKFKEEKHNRRDELTTQSKQQKKKKSKRKSNDRPSRKEDSKHEDHVSIYSPPPPYPGNLYK